MINSGSKKYLMQYTAGSVGTAMTWFVNQHENFTKVDFLVGDEYDIFLSGDSVQWNHLKDEDTETVFARTNNKTKTDFQHVCFKTFPHDVINDIEDFDEMNNKVKMMVDAGVNKWIFPMFYKETNYHYETAKVANRKYDVIAKRWQQPEWIADRNTGYNAIFATVENHSPELNPRVAAVLNNYGIHSHYMDTAALLGGDDNEYLKLARFLDTQPLTNWHDVLMSSIQFWNMKDA